jgi:hypothetical protein
MNREYSHGATSYVNVRLTMMTIIHTLVLCGGKTVDLYRYSPAKSPSSLMTLSGIAYPLKRLSRRYAPSPLIARWV